MRAKMTPSEARTLKLLSVLEIPVKAQVVCGRYIADFIGLDRNFVLEIDGPSHEAQQQYDAKRDEFFKAAGFQVIRILNQNVNRAFLDKLLRECKPWTKREALSRIWLASLLSEYWSPNNPADALVRLHCGVSNSGAE